MSMEEDVLKNYHQTQKFYNKIKDWYKMNDINSSMSFPVIAVYINRCIKRFKRNPKQKVIYLSFKYLDEIGYDYGQKR